MIVYLDTSALVALYVSEPGSAPLRDWLHRAHALLTHDIAYVEFRAALAKAVRLRALPSSGAARVRQQFEVDWRRLTLIQTTPRLIRRAGDIAESFSLRGFDSVHLAAAESLVLLDSREPIGFATQDKSLQRAAAATGLRIAG